MSSKDLMEKAESKHFLFGGRVSCLSAGDWPGELFNVRSSPVEVPRGSIVVLKGDSLTRTPSCCSDTFRLLSQCLLICKKLAAR